MNPSDRRHGKRPSALLPSLLLALPLCAPGCIIPTPLDGEPAPNRAPLILGGTPDFTAGPIMSSAQDDVELTVLAMDPDLDDTLVAGLYYGLERSGEPPAAMELSRAQLTFPRSRGAVSNVGGEGGTGVLSARRVCERLAAQPERDKRLHVYVTDRQLPAEFNPFLHTLPGDPWLEHSAHAQWILNCL